MIPAKEESVADTIKKFKHAALDFFKENTIGDQSNTKNQKYAAKLKDEIRQMRKQVLKLNQDQTAKYCEKLLDQLLNASVRQKQLQGLYQSVNDLDADLKYLAQEFQNQVYSQRGIKDSPVVQKAMSEGLLRIGMKISSDVFHATSTNAQNQTALLGEKVRSAESQLLQFKQTHLQTKTELEAQVAEVESKKNVLQSELIEVQQRLMYKEEEIKRLKGQQSQTNADVEQAMKELKDKLKQANLRVKQQEDEIKDLLSTNSAGNSELKKNIALLQQRLELNQRTIDDLRNQVDIKSEQNIDKAKDIKDLKDIVQELKKENKQLRARPSAVETTPDIPDDSHLKVEIEDLKNQLFLEQQNYIKLHAAFSDLEQKFNRLQRQSSQGNQAQKGKIMRDNDIVGRIESLELKIKEQEDSIRVLKRVKNVFNQTERVKCKGCKQEFNTSLFRGHVVVCQKLMQDPNSFNDIQASSDIDQLFIQAMELDGHQNTITFSVKWASQGVSKQFLTRQTLQDLQDTLLKVAKMHPEVTVFDEKNPFFSRLIFVEADSQLPSSSDLLSTINSLFSKVTQISALKQNQELQNFFGVGPDQKSPGNSQEPSRRPGWNKNSGSLLRQAV